MAKKEEIEKIDFLIVRGQLKKLYARFNYYQREGCTPENDVLTAWIKRDIDILKGKIPKEIEKKEIQSRLDRENAMIEAEMHNLDIEEGEPAPF